MGRQVKVFSLLAILILFSIAPAQFTNPAKANRSTGVEPSGVSPRLSAISVPTKPATGGSARQYTSQGGVKYILQSGSPIWLQSFSHAGCDWMGVGGQVFDAKGNPIQALLLHVSGSIGGQPVDLLGITGGAIAYGPGGYEITIARSVIESKGSLWIEVWDLNDKVLSDPIPINTFADCSRNLVLINFVQEVYRDSLFPLVRFQPPPLKQYMPVIFVDSKIRSVP
jgi:hypothetical protein